MAKSTPNQYVVRLSREQRERLLEITRNGHASAKKIRHAQILLWCDQAQAGGGITSREVARRLKMHVNTVDRIRKRFVLEGEQPALERKIRATPAVPTKLDGRLEAHLVAICCSAAPEGRTRWTLQLLADEMVKRRLVTSICIETVRKTLKKTSCNLGEKSAGACPSATELGLSRKWKTSSTSTRQRIATTSR